MAATAIARLQPCCARPAGWLVMAGLSASQLTFHLDPLNAGRSPARRMGEYSTETKSNRSAMLQSVSLPGSQLGRARFFNKIKHCRRVPRRYDKLAVNYLA